MPNTLSPPTISPVANSGHWLTFNRVIARMETGLTLFTGTPLASPVALPFCAPFLVRGETVVAVDGANRFNLYRLTEWAKAKRLSSPALLNELRIARSFTPFQLAKILYHVGGEMQRYRSTRLVITGLPDCLYDEELGEQEAHATFIRCRTALVQLVKQYTVLAFSDLPTHPIGGRSRFLTSLSSLARCVFEIGNTEPVSFVPIKAPGLLTLPKGDSKHGENHTDR